MSLPRFVILAACGVALVGCGGPTWSGGPRYAPAKPQAGFGTVYVYREPKAAASLAPMTVRIEERTLDVLNGSYGAFYLRPGKHVLQTVCAIEYVAVTRWVGITPAFGLTWGDASRTEADVTRKLLSVDLDVTPDKPLYVRVACGHLGSDEAALVSAPEATDAIAGLSLAPGGRARIVWDDLTP